ncbi:hypothetical protein J2S17_004400 [Cytobacillus purgationiresistens]|uniref:Uncharacterized protein n=1 Tax=Cytobacillus purgationiresistens TaxID=863449 RepID=A0ABU0AQ41_9BACI|nr:hypothetical protein [Cytobacillus purgationiresistens]
MTAPEEAFDFAGSKQEGLPLISMQLETRATEEQFIE